MFKKWYLENHVLKNKKYLFFKKESIGSESYLNNSIWNKIKPPQPGIWLTYCFMKLRTHSQFGPPMIVSVFRRKTWSSYFVLHDFDIEQFCI